MESALYIWLSWKGVWPFCPVSVTIFLFANTGFVPSASCTNLDDSRKSSGESVTHPTSIVGRLLDQAGVICGVYGGRTSSKRFAVSVLVPKLNRELKAFPSSSAIVLA